MKKYFLDLFLLTIFLLAMSFHFLPRNFHEIFGVVMFAAVTLHLIFNRRWFINLRQKKITRRNIFSTLIIFLMLATFLTISVTGICISNYLFNDFVSLEIRRNFTIHQLHVSSPYILMILIGLHIGLHWTEIWNRFLNFFGLQKKSLAYKIICKVFLLLIIFGGIYGAFLNRVGDRILMKHIFATPATELNFPEFLILFFATMGIYSIASYFLNKIL